MSTTKQNTTQVRLSFFTHALENNRLDAYDVVFGGNEATRSSLVGIEYAHDLSDDSASMTVTLKAYKESDLPAGTRGRPWVSLIEEGDWWGIDIVKNGKVIGLSYGRIDSVDLTIQAGAVGAATGNVIVKCRSMASVLRDTPIYFNPFDPAIDNALGINMLAVLDRLAGSPGEVCSSMIRGLMGGGGVDAILGGHYELPAGLAGTQPGQRWVDALDFETCTNLSLRGITLLTSAISPEGAPSVWDFVQSWRNAALNELFVDVNPTPGYPKSACLVVRERPFVNASDGADSPWSKLLTWYVDADLIESVELSRGHNRVNHVHLLGDLSAVLNNDPFGQYLPVANVDSIRRYGLHKLEESTQYFDLTGPSGFSIESRDWLSQIVSWNAINHEYWQGTIALGELRPEIRVGQKLAVYNGPVGGYLGLQAGGIRRRPDQAPEAESLTFYVEAVQHVWREGESPVARTILTVSRGYVEGERLHAVREAFEGFEVPQGTGAPESDGTLLNVLPEADARALDPSGGEVVA